ncbi:hypothetical protein [Nonomuraea basaltis]|uniref:hypothetical protein n=1 Tax=Nonomuraea basaltis TaxID=2495887 RepID=UPI00110C574F|nr:hypothetical protein [Nonomuraea basaltis]TMR96384.1 hypothetical protein EJK15_23625 [Nonomuraea basaltis]
MKALGAGVLTGILLATIAVSLVFALTDRRSSSEPVYRGSSAGIPHFIPGGNVRINDVEEFHDG